MGLIDFFKSSKSESSTINVSGIPSWQDFASLIDSSNYLEQYTGWTYKAVKTKADAVVSYEPVFKRGDKAVEDHQLLRDLKRFNDDITYRDARKFTNIYLGLAGIAYWYITLAEERGYLYEFQLLNPTKVEARTGAYGELIGYTFTDADGQQSQINKEDMIVFREPHPLRPHGGYGPLQASRLAHNTHEYMSKFNMNVFGNMGRPDGLLSIEGVDESTRKRMEKQLAMKYGGVENARKIGIVNAAMKWLPLTRNTKDLDYVNGVKVMRDDILSIHGVPKPLVGLTDSTYTNSAEAQRIFQRYTLKPLLDNEESVLNEQLIRKYIGLDTSYIFAMPNPVEADRSETTEVTVKAYQGGVLTLNEAREDLGKEPVDKGDAFFTDLRILPQDALSMITDEVKGQVDEVTKVADKAIQKAVETVDKVRQKPKGREKVKMFYHEKAVKQEARVAQAVNRFFREQENRVKVGKKSLKSFTLGFDMDFENEALAKILFAVMNGVADEYQDIANELVINSHTLTEKEKARIAKTLKGSAKLINETTQGKLKDIIAAASENGESVADVRRRIEEIYQVAPKRAETIARTEVVRVKNYVQDRVFRADDTVGRVEWLSAHDSSTRDAHASADGQQVKKGGKFDVGGELLKYPGDPSGSAANTINCRCTLIPVIE